MSIQRPLPSEDILYNAGDLRRPGAYRRRLWNESRNLPALSIHEYIECCILISNALSSYHNKVERVIIRDQNDFRHSFNGNEVDRTICFHPDVATGYYTVDFIKMSQGVLKELLSNWRMNMVGQNLSTSIMIYPDSIYVGDEIVEYEFMESKLKLLLDKEIQLRLINPYFRRNISLELFMKDMIQNDFLAEPKLELLGAAVNHEDDGTCVYFALKNNIHYRTIDFIEPKQLARSGQTFVLLINRDIMISTIMNDPPTLYFVDFYSSIVSHTDTSDEVRFKCYRSYDQSGIDRSFILSELPLLSDIVIPKHFC